MKKVLILFLGFFAVNVNVNAGLFDLFEDEDYSSSYYDYADSDEENKAFTIVESQKPVEIQTYNVPFYVKETPFSVPTVKAPPVLWGGEDLYYPYQLEPHLAKKAYETQMTQSSQTSASQNVAVVCRKAGCTRLNDKVTRQFLYNNMLNVFINNKFSKISVCEADPNTRACLTDSIKIGGRVGGTASVIQFPSVYVADVRFTKNMNKLDIYFIYDLYVNGVKAQCNGALTSVEVFANDQVIMRDESYKCNLTSGTPTQVFSMFNIDYIDLDYGILGGYYQIGLSGESAAGGNGYMLMKMHKKSISGAKTCADKECDEGVRDYQVPAGEYEVPLK